MLDFLLSSAAPTLPFVYTYVQLYTYFTYLSWKVISISSEQNILLAELMNSFNRNSLESKFLCFS